jgi:cyanate permease
MAFGIFGITSRFLWAILSARFDVRWVALGQALTTAAALALRIDNTVSLFVWTAASGLVLVGFFQLHVLLAVNYFGRAHIGAVRGLMWPLSPAATAAAPFVIGALRDSLGSYNGPFALVSVSWLLWASFLFSRDR